MHNPAARFSQDITEAFAKKTKHEVALAASIAYLRFSATTAIVGQTKNLAPVQVWTGIRRVRQFTAR